MTKDYAEKRAVLAAKCRRALPEPGEAEKKLDARIAALREELRAELGGQIPGSLPVLWDEKLRESGLYALCRALPKGADLHLHSIAVLPPDELIDFLRPRRDVVVGTLAEERGKLYLASDRLGAEDGRMELAHAMEIDELTRAELRELWSVTGRAPDVGIWDWFEKLFDRHMSLGTSPAVLGDYYRAAFRYLRENGVYHAELRHLFFGSKEDARAAAEAIREAYYEVRRDYPDFSARVLGAGLKYRHLPQDITDMLMENALYAHETVKDEFDPASPEEFVVGIDLVNEEDASRPLGEYEEMLALLRARWPEMRLSLHAGESHEPESDNLIDALLLGAQRVGHGLNLYRRPALLDAYRDAGVTLEVCPMSNQTLGYVPDLRAHPAVEYFRRGVDMVLASDDPAYQEITPLTDDFFAAAACWGFGAAELKALAVNSLRRAFVGEARKAELVAALERAWEEFAARVG